MSVYHGLSKDDNGRKKDYAGHTYVSVTRKFIARTQSDPMLSRVGFNALLKLFRTLQVISQLMSCYTGHLTIKKLEHFYFKKFANLKNRHCSVVRWEIMKS